MSKTTEKMKMINLPDLKFEHTLPYHRMGGRIGWTAHRVRTHINSFCTTHLPRCSTDVRYDARPINCQHLGQGLKTPIAEGFAPRGEPGEKGNQATVTTWNYLELPGITWNYLELGPVTVRFNTPPTTQSRGIPSPPAQKCIKPRGAHTHVVPWKRVRETNGEFIASPGGGGNTGDVTGAPKALATTQGPEKCRALIHPREVQKTRLGKYSLHGANMAQHSRRKG